MDFVQSRRIPGFSEAEMADLTLGESRAVLCVHQLFCCCNHLALSKFVLFLLSWVSCVVKYLDFYQTEMLAVSGPVIWMISTLYLKQEIVHINHCNLDYASSLLISMSEF